MKESIGKNEENKKVILGNEDKFAMPDVKENLLQKSADFE